MKTYFFEYCLFIGLLVNLLSACTAQSFSYQNPGRNSQAAQINAQLSLAYLQLGELERAKQKILLAEQEAPGDPLVWYTHAYLLEKTGDAVAAEKAYLTAIKLAANNGAAQNNYGVFLCRQGRYTSAIKHFLLTSQDPNYLYVANAYENAGVCAAKIPDRVLARKFFQQALAENPNLSNAKIQLQQLMTLP